MAGWLQHQIPCGDRMRSLVPHNSLGAPPRLRRSPPPPPPPRTPAPVRPTPNYLSTPRTKPSPFLRAMATAPQTVPSQSPDPIAPERRVVVANKHGERLVGVLHQTGSSKVVVVCHGFRSSKDNELMLSLTAALTKQGISVFRFDFSGNGESEGEFQYGNYRKEADDLQSVVMHLRQENYDVTAIVGHSKGGDTVVLYASLYDDVHMVANISGRFDLERGIEERIGKDFMDRIKKDGHIEVRSKAGDVLYRVTEVSLMERLNTDMRAASLSIRKECRVFTVHGSEDEVIPVGDAYEFAKVIPNHKLHIIEGANHCYTAHQEEVAAVVADFIVSNQAADTLSAKAD